MTEPMAVISASSAESLGTATMQAWNRLAAAGSPSARLDAEILVAHAAGRERGWLAAHPDAELNAAAAARLDEWLARRAEGEPIAYLRGWKEWHGHPLRTDPRALIPRPETELLADLAIEDITGRLTSSDDRLAVWDVGTGSGAIALVLARRFRVALTLGRVRLVASDLSSDALELASENLAAEELDGLTTLVVADLLEPAGVWLPKPDVVIANLPYVPSAQLGDTGSLRFEPRSALDGGRDGLDVVRQLLASMPLAVAPRASVWLEVGMGQAAAVVQLASATGMTGAVHPDLGGADRFVELRAP